MTVLSATSLWEQALQDLQGKLDEHAFNTWLRPVRMLEQNGREVTLAVPTIFYRNWLVNNYHEQLTESLSNLLRREVDVRYQVASEYELEAEASAETAQESAEDVKLSPAEREAMEVFRRNAQRFDRTGGLVHCPLNRNYTFDHFVVGESNRFAHAAAQAVADPQSRVYNPLFVYGGVGLGKTHLMQAIGHQLKTYGEHLNVLYVSSEAFMNAFIDAVAQKRLVEFRNCFRNVDLLMVDDVQFFAGAEQTQTEFFHTFNVLYDAGKKIVISSDHPPKELHELEDRLRSRFEWGLIVDIQVPDLETRVAILRRKARNMGMDIPQDVTIYIAERIRTNLRKLEGALTRLAAAASMTRQPITIDTARSLLGPFLVGDEPRKISVEKVMMAVCNYFSVTMHEMTGQNRARKLAYPRQIASYLARELTGASFPELARKFGGRDHSSIIHSHKKIKQDMAVKLDLQNLIKYLTKMIKEDQAPTPPQGH